MLKYLIKNTFIIDGSGQQGFVGSLGIEDDKLAFVSHDPAPAVEAENVIDGTGLVTCPGFIDIHSHCDLALPNDPTGEDFLLQGITTYLGGHCGLGKAPALGSFMKEFKAGSSGSYFTDKADTSTFDGWLSTCAPNGTGPNYGALVGSDPIRGSVMGINYTRAATEEEKQQMVALVEEALDAGAFGLSFSLDVFVTAYWADDDELIRLLEKVRDRNGLFAPHTRYHQNSWFSEDENECTYGLYGGYPGEVITGRMHGLMEAVELARRVPGLRLLVSHITPIYNIPQPHPSYVDDMLAQTALEEIIDLPRSEGLDVTFCMIPSDDSIGTSLKVSDMFFHRRQANLWPEFYKKGGKAAFFEGLKSREFRDMMTKYCNSGRMKMSMACPATDPYWSDCFTILKCANPEYVGKTVYELALARSPMKRTQAIYYEAYEVLYDILEADPEAVCAFSKDKREYNMHSQFLKHPCGMPMTDSQSMKAELPETMDPENPGFAPSTFCMFPRYLLQTVKRDHVMDLPEAIRKATSLPAAVAGFEGRGLLKEGMFADVVVMDWENLTAHHDYLHPNAGVDGIEYVFVNGKMACKGKKIVDNQAGRVLRRKK